MLGLFDRPVDANAIGILFKPPAIPGLTESLADIDPTQWRMILAKLRRARLLAGEDPHNLGHLDTHPLVREYFREQLQSQQPEAWKEANRRLYEHYRFLVPHLPNSFGEMEPLFLAVICGCNAGLFREALHEVYIPRIQRGNASFAVNVLGARGALLSVLCHFFEDGRWDSALETGVAGQNLTAEDQLFILIQAALNLSATRGFSTPEARICYERAESLCRSLDRPLLLYLALIGQWRYSLLTDSLTATMQIAKRIYSLAEEHNIAAFMVGACNALAATLYSLGDFENARQYAMRGVQVWSSGGAQSPTEEVDAPGITCLYFRALAEWHVGEVAASKSSMAEAVSLAKKLNDMHALVLARYHAAVLGVYERDPAEVERCASDLFELSTRQNFASHLSGATVLRGWARSVSGEAIQGISWIEGGIRDFRATGSILGMPFFLALKAEALKAAHRTSEALEAINEAERLVEKSGQRNWCAELHRLRGLFLAAIGAHENQIEASFSEAIRTAREQKSVSLAARAKASYTEYRRQRVTATEPLSISLPAREEPGRSIAVLPFESLSENKKDAYFADGVQDEILSNLVKVSQLRVISRTSVMTYRPGGDRDLRSIAGVLGVANVVEGTVRRDGHRVRITIRLVDARSDETLWSETYDRSLTDIFAIQSDIAQKVAINLAAQLSPKERKQIREKPTKDIEAYDLYLQAKALILDPQFLMEDEREALLRAIRLLDEATKKDLEFALAFCQIAKAHDALYWSKIDQTPERRAMADRAENEALRLRPDLAEVRIRAAWHHFVYRAD
jgi:TolB-like protein